MSGPAQSATLRLGFVPLMDCAPLVVADALGLFSAAGLRVSLSVETSWAGLRDKLAFGALDGAHMLYPMPIAAALGLGGAPRHALRVVAGLGQNGNCIVLSPALAEDVGAFERPLDARAFAAGLRRRAAAGAPPARLAVVFGYSSHNYLLRHWLAEGGVDPDADLRLSVVPPPRMGRALAEGSIDGFCAGEPWGSLAVAEGFARLALTTRDIWPDHPEKLLALREEVAEADLARAEALAGVIIKAARWLDDPVNHPEAALLLHENGFPQVPPSLMARALAGPSGLRFRPATRPAPEAAAWWLGAMRRWGHVPAGASAAQALAPWRTDYWRRAALTLGEAVVALASPAPLIPETAA